MFGLVSESEFKKAQRLIEELQRDNDHLRARVQILEKEKASFAKDAAKASATAINQTFRIEKFAKSILSLKTIIQDNLKVDVDELRAINESASKISKNYELREELNKLPGNHY